MAYSGDYETTDVVISGCGPTGAMLSAYLDKMSIRNVVLDKQTEIATDPRGIALDEDGIRLLQGLGIYDTIYSEIGTCMDKFKFIDGTGADLHKKPFLEMDYSTTEGGTGHVGFILHKQPALEKNLRDKMSENGFSEFRPGSTVVGISEDEQWTYCDYITKDGNTRRIRSRFLVGADGKTGFTRKKYLEAKGIQLERAHNLFYEVTWVALNWKIALPTKETHPDFPLWKLGYTPQEVYDNFFPTSFRHLCNPNRSAVCGRFGLPSDRLWRFEFVIHESEDGQEMAKPETIKKIVFPYITHAGSRYGLKEDVQYPEDCITVLRSHPFMFSARSCNRWSDGRVVLCGDAAHVFPPFGGQGIASGFRDAVSLAWRLAILCQRKSPSPTLSDDKILTAWALERKQQLEESLASTIRKGEYVSESSHIKIFIRNWSVWLKQFVPAWRDEYRRGQRKVDMIRYEHSDGMPFLPELNGGLCVPQVFCKSRDGKIAFSDDVIFRNKKGLFQILVYLKQSGTADIAAVARDLADIETTSKQHITGKDVTCVVESEVRDAIHDTSPYPLYTLATAEEFSVSPLCQGRPEPKYYEPQRLGRELKGQRYTILRPDRFVYASCSTKDELAEAVKSLASYVGA